MGLFLDQFSEQRREPILNVPAVVVVAARRARRRPCRARVAVAGRHRPRAGVDRSPSCRRATTPARSPTASCPAARAPRSGPSSPTRCCTPTGRISASTRSGCWPSPARWRGGSARVRFLLFFAVTDRRRRAGLSVAHAGALAPMIGASAGISGMMGAAARFAFQPGGSLDMWRRDRDERRPRSGRAAPCCAAQSARPHVSSACGSASICCSGSARSRFWSAKTRGGLGGPCRRLSRRASAVFAVRSGRSPLPIAEDRARRCS